MAGSLKLCTAEDVRQYVDLDDDTELNNIIDHVSEWLERHYLNRRFLAADYTLERHHGVPGANWILVKHPPARSVSAIRYWNGVGWTAYTLTYLVNDYDEETDNKQAAGIIRLRDYTLAEGRDNLQIDYAGGLETVSASLPDDLRTATALVAAQHINMKHTGGAGQTIATVEATGETVTIDEKLITSRIASLLDPWIRREHIF